MEGETKERVSGSRKIWKIQVRRHSQIRDQAEQGEEAIATQTGR